MDSALPRLSWQNATAYPPFPPPSLNAFRTAASRAAPDCAPALWFKQMTGRQWDCDSHSYELEKKRWRRLPYARDSEYVRKERERLAKRDQARLPVLQEKREQQRAQQLATDAEDEELGRTEHIFYKLLERARLIWFYCEDPRYFDRPRVPSFLAALLSLEEPLGPPQAQLRKARRRAQPLDLDETLAEPSRLWRPTQTELRDAKLRLYGDLIESAGFLGAAHATSPISPNLACNLPNLAGMQSPLSPRMLACMQSHMQSHLSPRLLACMQSHRAVEKRSP